MVSTENPEFQDFWQRYPRKLNKHAARRAFRKIRASELPALLAGLEAWKAYWKDLEFVPYPATWLNKRRWEDVPENGHKPTQGWSIPAPTQPTLYDEYLAAKAAGYGGKWADYKNLPVRERKAATK